MIRWLISLEMVWQAADDSRVVLTAITGDGFYWALLGVWRTGLLGVGSSLLPGLLSLITPANAGNG